MEFPRAAVAAAAFCLAALAGTALRRHTERATLSLAAHDYARIVEGTTVRIYKRTHASANALKDATWAMDNLGLSFLFNTTYTCSDDSPGDTAGGTPCADGRAAASEVAGHGIAFPSTLSATTSQPHT